MRSEEGSALMVQARQAAGARRHLKAIRAGDEKEGILFAGECIGAINEVLTVKQIIDGVIAEAEEALEATRKKIGKS